MEEFKEPNFKRPIEHSEDGIIAKKPKGPEDEQGDQCYSRCGALVNETPEDVQGYRCSSGSGTIAKKLETPEDEQGGQCSADSSLVISEQHSADIWPSEHSLNDLPDEILLMIMKHLNPDSLTALGLTCHRMNRVCRDRKLWTEVEISCTDILRYCDSYSMAHITKVLRVVHKDDNEDGYTGPCVNGPSLAFAFSAFRNLREVYMCDHYIDEQSFRMSMMPPSLRVWSFAGSSFKCWDCPGDEMKIILKDIAISTPNLREISFARCPWILPFPHFVEFTKLRKLRKLIIRERNPSLKLIIGFQKLRHIGWMAVE